ncbi:pentapeptide repeat-containing protein [Synechococcus sp. AH-736-G21]|nr:pentapeptide repeat-containing protein [Synechococcus sp. AH-736-G21]
MPKNIEYESYVKIKDSKNSTLEKQQDGTFVLTIKKPTLEYNDQYKIKAKEYVNNEDYVNSHTLTSGTEKFKADSGKLITLNYEVDDATYDKKSKEMVCIVKPLSKKDEKKANEIVEAEDDSQVSGLSPEDLRVRADKEKFKYWSSWFDKFHKKGLSSPAVISPGRDFRGKGLRDFDFRRADLRNADFRRADLTGANFLKADLRGADFRGANLGGNLGDGVSKKRANFQNADLRGADLRGAGLSLVDMSGSDLRDAKLKDAVILFTKLNHANLSGLDLSFSSYEDRRGQMWPSKIGSLRGANLSEANLSGFDMRQADARGANFYKTDLLGADFMDSKLQNANFYGANLKGAVLYRSNLSGADFRAADLVLADIKYASTRGTAWDSAICPNGLMADNSPCLPLSEKNPPQSISLIPQFTLE